MSIAYNNNLWTMNAMMFIKYKLCKTFNKKLYFENFRKVKPLANGLNKGNILKYHTKK